MLSPRLLVVFHSGSPQAHKPAGHTAASPEGARLLLIAASNEMLRTELGPHVDRGCGRAEHRDYRTQPIPDLPQLLSCPLLCWQHGEGLAGWAAGEQHRAPAQGLETVHMSCLRSAWEHKAGPPSSDLRSHRSIREQTVFAGFCTNWGGAACGRASLDEH